MRKFLLAIALVMALAAVAPAATVGPFSQSFSLTATPWATNLGLPAFDSNLGVLTGVLLELDATMSADLFAASGVTGGVFSLFAKSDINLSGPGGSPTISVNLLNGVSNVPLAANAFFSTTVSDSDSTSQLINSGLAAWQVAGGGTIFLPMDATGGLASAVSNFTPFLTQVDTEAEATARVTYYYDMSDVPEPSTYAMMGAGVGLLVLARARRRRS